MGRVIIVLNAVLFSLPIAFAVDNSNGFIVSGFPVDNVRYRAYSEGRNLVAAGRVSSTVDFDVYDARSKSVSISEPRDLLSTKFIALQFIIR